jgi:hypothetical protein
MTTISDLFPSRYLKASDAAEPVTLTITGVAQEKMKNRDGDEESKPVISFQEVEKPMVLNRTNAKTIAELYGETIEEWVGKKIILTSVDVDAFGETTAALRISHKKPAVDRKLLMAHYEKLYEKAFKLKVENLKDFQVDASTPEDALIEAGKQLKVLVEAAEAFQ